MSYEQKINKVINDIDKSFDKYRVSEALMLTYKLVWDDFCSLYLEIIKPEYGDSIDNKTIESTNEIFAKILKLLHPFMPFISEEIWHLISKKDSDIIVSQWPKSNKSDENLLKSFEDTIEIVSGIRNIRKKKNIAKKEKLELHIIQNTDKKYNFESIIYKLANLSNITFSKEKIENSFSFMIHSNEYFVPLLENFDKQSELIQLNKDLNYTIGFLKIVSAKLENKKFVENAPEKLVLNEKNKQEDAEKKIRILTEKIKLLS